MLLLFVAIDCAPILGAFCYVPRRASRVWQAA
jgi:hypothetical protein